MLKYLHKFINQNKLALQMCLVFFLFLIGSQENIYSQICSANAGASKIICGSTTTLNGNVNGGASGAPTWSLYSKPSGAPDPVIVSANTLDTDVTGMTADGNYVFLLSAPCPVGGASTNTITITAHPDPMTNFSAGTDVTNVCATTGTVQLNGTIPPGYTGVWTAENIYNKERFGTSNSQNATFNNNTLEDPVFSLTKKSDHDVDPAYTLTLTIKPTDGSPCEYKRSIVVRFGINPNINIADNSHCTQPGATDANFVDLTSAPYFSTAFAGASGGSSSGTTVVIEMDPAHTQPAGSNMSFNYLDGYRMYFNGADVVGTYKYRVVITTPNCGTYTSPYVSYTNRGVQPHALNFQLASHPEQLVVYSGGATAGEVHCGITNTNTPESFFFTIDPSDPASVTTDVTSNGVLPPGASTPTFTLVGDGTRSREVQVDPGVSGWKVGTYSFNISTTNGSCGIGSGYYIHVSDNSRPALAVADVPVCYPGSGAVAATVNLPAIYQETAANPSYFQDLPASYGFTVLSKPAGSGTLSFEASNLRSLKSTSTVISNLTMAGDYKIRMTPYNGNGVGPFLEQEYACSGQSQFYADFTIRVVESSGSNAGANSSVACSSGAFLQGNNPGLGSGEWTVVSTPSALAATPTIMDDENYTTQVSGFDTTGPYVFRWTVKGQYGACESSDDVTINIDRLAPVAPTVSVTQPNCATLTGTVSITTATPVGDTYTYSVDGGAFTSDPVFSNLALGSHSFVIHSSSVDCPSLPTTVTIVANCIDAINDAIPTVDGDAGNNNAGNIFNANPTTADTVDGAPATIDNVDLEILTTAGAGLFVPRIDLTNGNVIVPAGTPAGMYTIVYKICDKLKPANCDSATVTIPVTVFVPNPSISVTKDGTYQDSAAPLGVTNVGDVINYKFVVTNTGNVTLTNVTIADNNANVSGTLATLGIGVSDSTTFTAVHTITQADIDAGTVYNLAIVSGTPPTGAAVTNSSTDPTPCTACPVSPTCTTCTATPLLQSPSISVTKDGTYSDSTAPLGVTNVGDVINYKFVVTNTGNVTLTNVTIADNNANVSGTLATLGIGVSDSTTFTAVHTITQADIDAGTVYNLAIVSGTPPTGAAVTNSSTDPTPCTACPVSPTCTTCTTTPLSQSPSISVTKDGTYNDVAPLGVTSIGETITYKFVVTNTGNVPLTNITVTDNNANVSGTLATLGVGVSDSTTFTAVHTITQADIDAGTVYNLAIVTGTPPTGAAVTDSSTDPTPCTACPVSPTCTTCTATPLLQNPSITVSKDGTYNDVAPLGVTSIGETITYKFVVTNTGNVSLTNVTVMDNNAIVTGNPLATLGVGASDSTTFTAVHTITQADIDAGTVYNLAIVSGTPPTGAAVTNSSTDPTPCTACPVSPTCTTCTATPLLQNPSISVTKDGTYNDVAPLGVTSIGETITYKFVVTNTGNVPLTNVTVMDNNAIVTGNPLATLGVGASDSTTFTAVHTITQADINAGIVYNLAIVSGTPPTGAAVTNSSTDPTPCTACPVSPTCPTCTKTELIKTVIDAVNDAIPSTNGGAGNPTAGNVLTNDTLNNIPVLIENVDLNVTTPARPLTPGALVPVVNPATGIVNVPAGTPAGTYTIVYQICEKVNPANCDSATVTVPVTVSVIVANDDPGTAVNGFTGGTAFTNVLENDRLNGVTVVEADVNLKFVSSTNPGVTLVGTNVMVAPGTPGGSYTLTYSICEKVNSTNCDDAVVTVFVEAPALHIVKTGVFNDENKDGYAQAGETITYSFNVSNIGNVPLTNVTVTDTDLVGLQLTGTSIPSLAVGASDSTAYSATYTVTQADINKGTVSNQAIATGTSPNNTEVRDLSNDSSPLGDQPTVLDINGCVIEVFNAMSPNNGDSLNNVFYIRGLECYPDNTVEIYNRWGVLVFERDHYNNTDRAFKGISEGRVTVNQSQELPVGTYYYILKYKDNNSTGHEKAGYLYINRK